MRTAEMPRDERGFLQPVHLGDRFWPKLLVIESGCWEWQGSKYSTGYGQIWLNGRHVVAHRLAYESLIGEIPDGLELDHLCRNRGCVNPHHLEAVTHSENTLRSPIHISQVLKSRTHCSRGHEYTPDNTRIRYSKGYQWRSCRKCKYIGRGDRRVDDKRTDND